MRRNIGIIFQNPSIDLHLSGEENIRLHAALYGMYAYRPGFALMPRRIPRACGAWPRCSVGARAIQAAADLLGRDAAQARDRPQPDPQSRVLFLDEPTSGLDPVSRRDLWEYLRKVRAEDSTTIFLTTHYLEEAEGADRACAIDHGGIAIIGTPDELKHQLLDRSSSWTP